MSSLRSIESGKESIENRPEEARSEESLQSERRNTIVLRDRSPEPTKMSPLVPVLLDIATNTLLPGAIDAATKLYMKYQLGSDPHQSQAREGYETNPSGSVLPQILLTHGPLPFVPPTEQLVPYLQSEQEFSQMDPQEILKEFLNNSSGRYPQRTIPPQLPTGPLPENYLTQPGAQNRGQKAYTYQNPPGPEYYQGNPQLPPQQQRPRAPENHSPGQGPSRPPSKSSPQFPPKQKVVQGHQTSGYSQFKYPPNQFAKSGQIPPGTNYQGHRETYNPPQGHQSPTRGYFGTENTPQERLRNQNPQQGYPGTKNPKRGLPENQTPPRGYTGIQNPPLRRPGNHKPQQNYLGSHNLPQVYPGTQDPTRGLPGNQIPPQAYSGIQNPAQGRLGNQNHQKEYSETQNPPQGRPGNRNSPQGNPETQSPSLGHTDNRSPPEGRQTTTKEYPVTQIPSQGYLGNQNPPRIRHITQNTPQRRLEKQKSAQGHPGNKSSSLGHVGTQSPPQARLENWNPPQEHPETKNPSLRHSVTRSPPQGRHTTPKEYPETQSPLQGYLGNQNPSRIFPRTQNPPHGRLQNQGSPQGHPQDSSKSPIDQKVVQGQTHPGNSQYDSQQLAKLGKLTNKLSADVQSDEGSIVKSTKKYPAKARPKKKPLVNKEISDKESIAILSGKAVTKISSLRSVESGKESVENRTEVVQSEIQSASKEHNIERRNTIVLRDRTAQPTKISPVVPIFKDLATNILLPGAISAATSYRLLSQPEWDLYQSMNRSQIHESYEANPSGSYLPQTPLTQQHGSLPSPFPIVQQMPYRNSEQEFPGGYPQIITPPQPPIGPKPRNYPAQEGAVQGQMGYPYQRPPGPLYYQGYTQVPPQQLRPTPPGYQGGQGPFRPPPEGYPQFPPEQKAVHGQPPPGYSHYQNPPHQFAKSGQIPPGTYNPLQEHPETPFQGYPRHQNHPQGYFGTQNPPQGRLGNQNLPQGYPRIQNPTQGRPLNQTPPQRYNATQNPSQVHPRNQNPQQRYLGSHNLPQGYPGTQNPTQGFPGNQTPPQGYTGTQNPLQRYPSNPQDSLRSSTSYEVIQGKPPPDLSQYAPQQFAEQGQSPESVSSETQLFPQEDPGRLEGSLESMKEKKEKTCFIF